MTEKCTERCFFIFSKWKYLFLFVEVFFGLFFGLFKAAPMAYGGSQARGQILAVATGLPHSHNDGGSELSL